ncbi:hypothetical protein OC842_006433 [Tilletia horrida]|uniref:Wax synthase domain-containing protein n=1 Tax=Tilletia horrida TaxID=155126 RepID=A0AAN6G791_9BASI|nr:hypothetical protein OC842_006433 [Tilletia horrida]
MAALSSLLARAGRWAYPPFEELIPLEGLNALGMLTPIPLLVLEAHLLLRYSHSPALNAIRRYVLFPLTCLVALRSVFSYVMPDVHHDPAPPGSFPRGVQAFGTEPTVSRDQAVANANGTLAGVWILKAAELCLGRNPPKLNTDMMKLQKSLQGKGGVRQEVEASSTLQSDGAQDDSPTSGLRRRTVTNGKAAPDSATTQDSQDENDSRLDPCPRFLPCTRIPLEVDLALSSRGYGWNIGPTYAPGTEPVDLLPPRHSAAFASLQTRRRRLILSGLRKALIFFVVYDIEISLLIAPYLWGPRANLGAPERLGGVLAQSLYFSEMALWQRVALTCIVGSSVTFNTHFLYGIYVAVQLLPAYLFPTSALVAHYTYADPAHWEPVHIFNRVWHPQSIRRLWGREWHQALTRLFVQNVAAPLGRALDALGCGADAPTASWRHKPTRKSEMKEAPLSRDTSALVRAWRGRTGRALHRASTTLAVFAASGLLHEAGMLTMARTEAERDPWRLLGIGMPVPTSPPASMMPYMVVEAGEAVTYDRGGKVLLFFVMQGVGCILEDLVELLSAGRGRVGGLAGSLWAISWFFGWGYVCAEPFFRMGALQGTSSLRLTGVLLQTIHARFFT